MKLPTATFAALFFVVGCTTSSEPPEDAPPSVAETRGSPGLQAVMIQALGME